MSTTTPPETPVRADTSSLNPDALKQLSTAAENRKEKGMIKLSKEATENLKTRVKGQIVLPSDWSYDAVREIWNMRNVRVDAEKKRAYVEPGATMADFDEAARSAASLNLSKESCVFTNWLNICPEPAYSSYITQDVDTPKCPIT